MKRHATTRRVWAVVTADPHASIRELMVTCALGSTSAVRLHLLKLERLGYISRDARLARSIRVLMPFVEVGR